MSEFKKYVASLYPDDTAVIEDWSEKDFIEDYDDLYEKFKKDKGLISEFDMFCAEIGILDWCDEDEARKIWNHQQAKIDDLQAKYDELNNRATGIALDQMTTAKLNYELQGRIDEALLKLTEKKIMYVDIVAETIDILKGNKDEK